MLAVEVYRVTSEFPTAERFGLSAQMRRAAVSIGSNIAEGCGRSGEKEFVHFLHVALGSASELEFQGWIAADLAFLDNEAAAKLLDDIEHLKLMLVRLIKAVLGRSRRPTS